jgi:hypothetical protein
MALTPHWIKLGRCFMVASIVFYILPISVILTHPFRTHDKVIAMTLLVGSGLVWTWFRTRTRVDPTGASASSQWGWVRC